MDPRDLLAGVTLFTDGTGDAVRVAVRLLEQLGAQRVDTPHRSRLVLLDETSASDLFKATDGVQTVVSIDGGLDDLLLQAAAGISAGIGAPGRPPLKLPLAQSARQGGLTMALAACASLLSTQSVQIDLAILDVWSAFYSGPDVANARFGRSKTARGGHRTPGTPWPRTILPCADGYFAVQCATRDHWLRFLALTGKPELEASPMFADRIAANDHHGDEADAIFAPWFRERTKAELTEAFLRAKLPGAPVYSIDEVAAHEHLRLRDAFGERGRVNVPYRLISGSASPRGEVRRSAHAPLAGIRVVDFGWVWAGAVPGHILADLGAEVIKIETATHLDYMRQGRPIVGTRRDPDQNPMFASINRGKLSFRIDMTHPDGAALLRELVATSDVVIENFSPGVLERHGLGWEDLSRVRQGLVMCSMSAAGATGPLRDIRTYATMIAGLCGLDSMVGYPGERVLGSQSSYCDPNASLHATLAILGALVARERSGEGCWIDLSQWQAGLHAVEDALVQYARDGTIPSPAGLHRSDRLIHNCFPAAGDDEWIAISARNADELRVVAESLGLDAVNNETVARATSTQPIAELVRRLPRTVAARVAKPSEVSDDPRIAANGLFEDVEHPILGAVPVYRLPWRLDGVRPAIRARAPLFGEHTEYVLNDILRIAPERVAALTAAKVFE